MLILPFILAFLPSSPAAVTIYGQLPLAQTNTAYRSSTTALAAYNDTTLTPPPIPSPPPTRGFLLVLQRNANAVRGLSIPHTGGLSFFGFSIETSVVSQVVGKNSSLLSSTFLNLIGNIAERAGGVPIRIGGNTQEFAVMLDKVPGAGTGQVFGKEDSGSNATTQTPAVIYTRDMFYMASNVSSLVNVRWFFGIPFNDSVNWRLTIAEESQQILGDNLLGLQAGNEPDFYSQFGRRTAPYNPADYGNEVASLIKKIDANPRIPVKNNLIGPSVATGPWTPEQVWDTGFMDRFKDRFYAFSVEHYPDNNCAAQFNTGGPIIQPSTVFPFYLSHKPRVVDLVAPYIPSTLLAQKYSKPFIMFETNTASCGGFAGVSNTFGAALWATDYGLQLAFANFSNALLHVGGHDVFYNPFTSPPTNQTEFNQWTVGAVYYSAIVLAEAFGTSNTSRVIDLNANQGNEYTPAYAIYENGVLSKIAAFNYVEDRTGGSSLAITLAIQGVSLDGTIKVKYLEAPSVSTRDNIKWGGQTMGGTFQADGRFKGTFKVTTIECALGACTVPVPAPGFALIFINTTSPSNAQLLQIGQGTRTYPITRRTISHNTATVDWTEVGQSNGRNGSFREVLRSSDFEEKISGAEGEILRARLGSVWIGMMTTLLIDRTVCWLQDLL